MRHILLIYCFFISFSSISFAGEKQEVGGLTIDQCVQIILVKNPSLSMIQAEAEQKSYLFESSKKDLYPALSAHYSYTHQSDAIFFPKDQVNYGVTVEQPLYRGKSLVTSVNKAELEVKSSSFKIEQEINDLVYLVHEYYFALLRSEKLKEVAEQAVVRLQSHRRDAAAFYEAGLIPKNQFLQSEVELAQGEQDLVDVENIVDMNRARLNNLLDRKVDAFLAIADCCDDDIDNVTWEKVLDEASKSRAEILQAKLQVDIAESDVILKRAPYLPMVSLSASYDRYDDVDVDGSSFSGFDQEVKTVSAIASWRFWTWNKEKEEVLGARMNVKRTQKALDAVIDNITLDARNAFLHLEQAAKRIKVSEKAIIHAKENFRINTARYQSQLATSTDVLDAQSLLSEALKNHLDSIYGHRLAYAAVEKATGKLGKRFTQ